MPLPSVPDGSSTFRTRDRKLAHLRDLRLELCSHNKESLQLALRAASPLVPAVTLLVILGACVLVPRAARAQAVYGSIFGTITDQSGAAVVGAKLTVTSVQ